MPKTPQQLFLEAQTDGRAQPGDTATVPVVPPAGSVCFLHAGPACRRLTIGTPLAADAIAWSFQGAPRWFMPHEWPWGQLTREDEQLAKEVAKQFAATRGRFDERGRVDHLPSQRQSQPVDDD